MGIDTVSKLHSMISYGDIFQIGVPIPDGSFTQGDLQHILHGYSGVLWTKAVIVGDTITGLPCITIKAYPMSLGFAAHPISLGFKAHPISIGITGESPCQ